MKIAAISDIHGNLGALDAVLADIAKRRVDVVVNLGDILSGSLRPRETARRLMPLSFASIRGNHERQVLDYELTAMGTSDRYAAQALTRTERDWIEAMPATLQHSPDVFLCHGTPSSDTDYLLEIIIDGECQPAPVDVVRERLGDCRTSLVLCGHSHVPRVAFVPSKKHGQTIVNPGSVGLQAYLDKLPAPHRVQNGSPHARYAVIDGNAPHWNVDLISVAYDWDATARLALRHERPEWVNALRTGFV